MHALGEWMGGLWEVGYLLGGRYWSLASLGKGPCLLPPTPSFPSQPGSQKPWMGSGGEAMVARAGVEGMDAIPSSHGSPSTPPPPPSLVTAPPLW